MNFRTAPFLACIALAAACSDSPTAVAPLLDPTTSPVVSAVVPGQYVVMLKETQETSSTVVGGRRLAASFSRMRALVASTDGEVKDSFTGIVNGFTAQLSDSAVAALRADSSVAVVEPDVISSVMSGTQTQVTWGIDRIDQQALPLDRSYTYANTGAGVAVYMIDTGIDFTNAQFGGRAVTGFDAVTSGGTAKDCMGHGTETASIVGSASFGVAKGVQLYAVRVYDCTGSGSQSGPLNGINWVAKQKAANPTKPMVANMSLAGGSSATLDTAVVRLLRAGVVVVAAAGNAATDACRYWPAHVAGVITAAGSDQYDTFYPKSNYGKCIALIAPAVNAPVSYIGNVNAAMTGTSASAPYVAGAAALYLAANPSASPAQVRAALIANATPGKIKNVPANTPNLLLNTSFIGGSSAPNSAPTVAMTLPSINVTVAAGVSVSFAASATDSEDGTLSGASVVWTSSRDGRIGTGLSLASSALTTGVHTITVTATDSKGATAVAARAVTIVAPTNLPPVVAITQPLGSSFAAGVAVTFAGTALDPEAGLLSGPSLKWTSSRDGAIGSGTSVTTSALSVGTHVITLVATDAKGASATDTHTVTIAAPQSPSTSAPSAAFTWDCTSSAARQCTLDATTSVSGASIVSYAWDWGTGKGETHVTSTARNTWPTTGAFSVTLTILDASGATDTITKTITIP